MASVENRVSIINPTDENLQSLVAPVPEDWPFPWYAFLLVLLLVIGGILSFLLYGGRKPRGSTPSPPNSETPMPSATTAQPPSSPRRTGSLFCTRCRRSNHHDREDCFQSHDHINGQPLDPETMSPKAMATTRKYGWCPNCRSIEHIYCPRRSISPTEQTQINGETEGEL